MRKLVFCIIGVSSVLKMRVQESTLSPLLPFCYPAATSLLAFPILVTSWYSKTIWKNFKSPHTLPYPEAKASADITRANRSTDLTCLHFKTQFSFFFWYQEKTMTFFEKSSKNHSISMRVLQLDFGKQFIHLVETHSPVIDVKFFPENFSGGNWLHCP